MAELIYRGNPPVGPAETQALLGGSFSAIWAPPMYRHATPAEGDRLWVIWQAEGQAAQLLGRGVIVVTNEGSPDWTNRTAPGIVEAAQDQGYGGPTNMAFLRLRNVRLATGRPQVTAVLGIPTGLSVLLPSDLAALGALFPEDGAAQQ